MDGQMYYFITFDKMCSFYTKWMMSEKSPK